MAKKCGICDRLNARKYKKGGLIESTMLKDMDESDLKHYHSLNDNDKVAYSNAYLKGIDEKTAGSLLDKEYAGGGPVSDTPTMEDFFATQVSDKFGTTKEDLSKQNAQPSYDKKSTSLSSKVNNVFGKGKGINSGQQEGYSNPISNAAGQIGGVGTLIAAGVTAGHLLADPTAKKKKAKDEQGLYLDQKKAIAGETMQTQGDPVATLFSKDKTGKQKLGALTNIGDPISGYFINRKINKKKIQEEDSTRQNEIDLANKKTIPELLEEDAVAKGRKKTLGLAKGGTVKGEGTGTSDDVPMKADTNDFVIPADAMKSPIVKGMMKKLGLDKPAPKSKGTERIFASNGEGLVPKNKIAKAEAILGTKGLTLSDLAPEAKSPMAGKGLKDGLKEGGKVDRNKPDQKPKMKYVGGGPVVLPSKDKEVSFEFDEVTGRMKVIKKGKVTPWEVDASGRVYNAKGEEISHQDFMSEAKFGKTGSAEMERGQLKEYWKEAKQKSVYNHYEGYDPSKSIENQSEDFKKKNMSSDGKTLKTLADVTYDKQQQAKNADVSSGVTKVEQQDIIDSQKDLNDDQKAKFKDNPELADIWALQWKSSDKNTPDDFNQLVADTKEETPSRVPGTDKEPTGISINQDKGTNDFQLTEEQQKVLKDKIGDRKPESFTNDELKQLNEELKTNGVAPINIPDSNELAKNAEDLSQKANTGQEQNYGFNVSDILAAGQIAGGMMQIFSQGQEPEYKKSEDLLDAHRNAVSASQFGFTPAELQQQKNQIAQNTATTTGLTNKLAMSSAGTAYGMALNNLLTENKANLSLKVADDTLKFKKQGYADSFARALAEEDRYIFREKERRFERDTNAGSELLNAGIANLFGNQKLKAEKDFYKNLNTSTTVNPGQ